MLIQNNLEKLNAWEQLSCDIRNYSLEEEIRNVEENATINFVCENCVEDANH